MASKKMTKCELCGSSVKANNLEKHMKNVHDIDPTAEGDGTSYWQTREERRARRKRDNLAKRRNDTIATAVAVVMIIAILSYAFVTELEAREGGTNIPGSITPPPIEEKPGGDEVPVEPSSGDNRIATIITSMGTIKFELYEDKAPNTCDNFIEYAEDGFFNGLIFHRVIDDFVIQGGGFYPDMTQKTPTYPPLDLEIHPDLKHTDGAVSMARTSDPNSATSQFFINDGAQPSLEPGGVDANGYAVFGQVISGMDVVRAIASVPTGTQSGYSDVPNTPVLIQSVTIGNS